MTTQLWIVVGALVGLLVVWGLYKFRGGPVGVYVASAVAVVFGAAAAIMAASKRKPSPSIPPPADSDAAEVVKPVVALADEHAEEERTRIREAESETDRMERLRRLAALNNSGRE